MKPVRWRFVLKRVEPLEHLLCAGSSPYTSMAVASIYYSKFRRGWMVMSKMTGDAAFGPFPKLKMARERAEAVVLCDLKMMVIQLYDEPRMARFKASRTDFPTALQEHKELLNPGQVDAARYLASRP